MDADTTPHSAQLDTAERQHLQEVVERLRDRVEANLRYRLTQHQVDTPPTDLDALDDTTRDLYHAIALELTDSDVSDADTRHVDPSGHSIDPDSIEPDAWADACDQYVTATGYTILNRLAALRCMEVRGFLDREVTRFTHDGLTPAAHHLVTEEFHLEDEAIITAYHTACDRLADELDILFDRSTPYSLLDPDADTYRDLCAHLDDIPDSAWQADDVLGWVYEYYNRPRLDALDDKNTLQPDDIGPANQFYTPHWVVRMLTDNALGTYYLEATDRTDALTDPEASTPHQRKTRGTTPEDAPTVADLCTYCIPPHPDGGTATDSGPTPEFEHPADISVIDPACGSGHFLLYAFEVLERIWWAETDVPRHRIPAEILRHNLHGVDIDRRACQLTAFNLYLKARARTEAEGGPFEMPPLNVVCADAHAADIDAATDAIDDLAGSDTALRAALAEVLETFRTTPALGSLLDVKTTLADAFAADQTTIDAWTDDGPHTLNEFLRTLRDTVADRTADSFSDHHLRSLLHLLVVLTTDYDVALMNPPYGSGGRMPDAVRTYVESHYRYTPEYYIAFFEACDRLTVEGGRIGMLVPWSFMFNRSFQSFREEFVGARGAFDFFAEFGYDILDNATVGTVGTVVRSGAEGGETGTFMRLPDVPKAEKEHAFLHAAFVDAEQDGVQRRYERSLAEFGTVPGTPLSYWVPPALRSIYDADCYLDAEKGRVSGDSLGEVSAGLCTGDDGRFVRYFWEAGGAGNWVPFAKGGSDAFLLPRVSRTVDWNPRAMAAQPGGRVQNTGNYFSEALSYTVAKRSGRRFGYLHPESIFSHKGSVLLPDRGIWSALAYTNSHLFTYLMLTQTAERMWEIGFVSKVPWRAELAESERLERLAQEAVGHRLSKRQYEFTSPHYDGPLLLDVLGVDEPLPRYDHPHRDLRDRLDIDEPEETLTPEASLGRIATVAARHRERIDGRLQACTDAIDTAVFDAFDIAADHRATVRQEIALRTIDDPRDTPTYDPDSITGPPEDYPELVKDLLLHLALRAVQEADDGIVPLVDIPGHDYLLARIESAADRQFGEHAAARLAEIDSLLGDRPADDEPYPNLRRWLETDLFDYHVDAFERTPICWQLTSTRLVPDPHATGFACLLDYHSLDTTLFDRLETQYLDPRKAHLRDQRTAANRRRTADSHATDRADATTAYQQAENALQQLDQFETELATLARPTPRDWPERRRETAAEAAETVARYRAETAARLQTLDSLAALDTVDMPTLFSPTFYDTVQENRTEWLDGLDALETAFDAYTADPSDPVEAHHYDLLTYYDDLAGSAHYASTGIRFMTYYFDRIDTVDQDRLGEDAPARDRLLADLATGVEGYDATAERIGRACDTLADAIPSDWTDRALAEITTTGYDPTLEHGVTVNIRPLAEAELVPRTVDRDVL